MNQTTWTAVDSYLSQSLIAPDAALESVLEANEAAGLPAYDVAPNQGKLLHLLALFQGSRRILEIGTLGGYSTIWLARALPPGGVVVTLEANPMHAQVAAANIARAGLASAVQIHLGPAVESLAKLHGEGTEPFDLIFIDADKPNNPTYLEWALKLSRRGTLIIGDNVVRDGAIADTTSADPNVKGVQTFLTKMGAEPRLSATAIQTVGSKGYDGFALALVIKD